MRYTRLDKEVQMLKSILLFPGKCVGALFLAVTSYVILAALAIALLIGACYAVGYVLKGGTYGINAAREAAKPITAVDRE